jgi:hypothetical protein
MTPEAFAALIAGVTAGIAGKPLDRSLDTELNRRFPPEGETFRAIKRACESAIAAGWMCSREAQGIKYGRVLKPGAETHGFSVDVVEMADLAGPHHRHPNGEIDMIMPLTPGAEFDGRGGGWLVYGPGTAHRPTVAKGRALVLYLLPQGAIEFMRG